MKRGYQFPFYPPRFRILTPSVVRKELKTGGFFAFKNCRGKLDFRV